MALDNTIAQQDHRLDIEVAAFLLKLGNLLRRAQTFVVASLLVSLTTKDGRIVNSTANRAILRKTDVLLNGELSRLGLKQLTDAFVSRFPAEQIGAFTRVLEQTVRGSDLSKVLNFSQEDRNNLAGLQMDTATQLEELVARATEQARYNALAGVGGVEAQELAANVSGALDRLPGVIKGTAEDSISVFYRTVADLGYRNLEASGTTLDFRYVGPDDYVTRPFCQKLIRASNAGETRTRAQIEAMDNGQAKYGKGAVFTCGGGWGCRHQWVVATAKIRVAGA